MIEPVGDTWQTPKPIIDLAKKLMGGIDMDPASSEEANIIVGASRFYTREQNGLANHWNGRVWINPPFSKVNGISQAGAFLRMLLLQYRAGFITEGLILTNVCTDTVWFQSMWYLHLCFLRSRLRFTREDHDGKSPRYANVVGYLGPQPQRFATIFGTIGHIVTPSERLVIKDALA